MSQLETILAKQKPARIAAIREDLSNITVPDGLTPNPGVTIGPGLGLNSIQITKRQNQSLPVDQRFKLIYPVHLKMPVTLAQQIKMETK